MEVPESVYNWLRSTGVFQIPAAIDSFILPEEICDSLESGLGFVKLIKRMNQIKVTAIKNKLDRLTTPFPKLNTLKQVTGSAVKLYNWKIISEALELFGVVLDMDTKTLIIAGDREMLVEVLKQVRDAEDNGFVAEGKGEDDKGVDLDAVEDSKALTDAENCVEFFILSFSQCFGLKPKQGAGLLAQGAKYLAHIIAKGLKGDFEPVKAWLQEIYSKTDKLSSLMDEEQESGAVSFVLSALKPGILSKDLEVVQWSLRLLSRLILDLNEKAMLGEVWKWFTNDNVMELCIVGLKRMGKDVYHLAIDLLLQIGQYSFYELFTQNLRNVIQDTGEYLEIISEFLPHVNESQAMLEEISASGVIGYWCDLALKEAEAGDGKSLDTRASGISFLSKFLTSFFPVFEENESLMNSVLGLLNRASRDDSRILKMITLGEMFYILNFMVEQKSAFAPVLYRTLTFILVEAFTTSELREFIQSNFGLIFRSNEEIPIGILVEPYIKRLQVSDVALEIFDYDFLVVIAQYPALNLRNAIQMIDIIGKNYLNDLTFSKVAGVPFTHIASRFIQTPAMQDYLYVFADYSLSTAIVTEQQKLKKGKKQPDLDEKLQQRNRILDMISWIVQQWQDNLNAKIKNLLLKSNFSFVKIANTNCKSVMVVLDLLGDSDVLFKEFKDSNPTVVPITDSENLGKNIGNYALVPVSEALNIRRNKGAFPWDRINDDIEKAKRKRQEKDNKIKEEELKQKKALDFKKKKLKKQLEVRKLEQGVGREDTAAAVFKEGVIQKYITQDEVILKEFTAAEADLEESVKLMMSKYSRVFKFLFSKYSGTGFETKHKGLAKSDFDMHKERKWKLNDAEYIRIMKDFQVIPKLLNKEELRAIMRTYNHKIAKQAEQRFVDYKGFKGVFCQIAYYVYSRRPYDYSHLPPVVSLKFLLEFMRDALKAQGKSTENFDEPDPGNGDKEIVRSLNKLLQKDPKAVLPQGYERIMDKEIKVFFSVPSVVSIPVSFKHSIEILDDLLEKTVGIRILEPQIEFFETFRAKGVFSKKQEIPQSVPERKAEMPKPQEAKKQDTSKKLEPIKNPEPAKKLEPNKKQESKNLDPIKPAEEKKISKGPTPVPPPPPIASQGSVKVGQLSPTLKLKVAQAPAKMKNIIEECAYVLEDILHSVKLKMKRVINRAPKGSALNDKLEAIRMKLGINDDDKRIEEEKKRKLRQDQLLEELKDAKEARQKMLKDDEEKRKNQAFIDEIKRKVIEEKLKKERNDKKKQLEEWQLKRDLDEKEKKEEIERKKREQDEMIKADGSRQRNKERFENIIKEREKAVKQMKKEETLKLKKELKEKEIKKERGIKHFLESKAKEETKPKDSKKEFILLLNNNEIKNFVFRYEEQIADIFAFYLNQMNASTYSDGSINQEIFSKFCQDFSLTSFVSQSSFLSAFNFLTKKKSIALVNYEEFKKALILLANLSKENLGIEDSGVDAVEKFFEKCEISLEVKPLKKKLKKLKEIIDGLKPKPKNKRPTSLINAAKIGYHNRSVGEISSKQDSFKAPNNELNENPSSLIDENSYEDDY